MKRTERWLAWALRRQPFGEDLLGDLLELAPGARRRIEMLRVFLRFAPVTLLGRKPVRHGRARGPAPTKNLNSTPSKEFSMRRWMLDLRLSLRGLKTRPGTAALIVLTLSVGLAANAAVFGLLDALILRPFTFFEAERVVMLGATVEGKDRAAEGSLSPADFLDLRARTRGEVLEALVGYDMHGVNLLGPEGAERVLVSFASLEFFDALRVRPAHGRFFVASDSDGAEARPLVLSDALWRRRFSGALGVVGRTLTLDDQAFTVVGVAPAGFSFPPGSLAWAPFALSTEQAAQRDFELLGGFGRLADGVTMDAARERVAREGEALAATYPATNTARIFTTETVAKTFEDAGALPIVLLWQAAAGLVLLIGWFNVSHLIIARGQDRRRQLALLEALGAGRFRIVSLLLTEGLVLGLLAALAAVPLAALAQSLLREAMPASIRGFVSGWERIGFDPGTLALLIGLALLSTAAVSLWPALRLVRGSISNSLREGGRGTSAGVRRQRARGALIVGEVALGLVLVVASSIAVRGARGVILGLQGFESQRVLTWRMSLSETKYADRTARAEYVRSALASLGSLPGVESAMVTNVLPGRGNNSTREIALHGEPEPQPGKAFEADYRTVSADYFSTLRIPVVNGRGIVVSDDAGSTPVAVVSRSMAERFWPGRDPLGQKFRGGEADTPWLTVVGVAADHLHHWFDRRNYPTFFVPYTQQPRLWIQFAIKTHSEPEALEAAVRKALATIDPTQAAFDLMSLEQLRAEGAIGLTFAASVMSVLAGLALALAASGIYGVMSYHVSTRTRDIGVRVALGATALDVLRATVGQVFRLAALGLVIGLGLSVLAGRAIASVLRDTAELDVASVLGAAALLALAAVLAAILPARRALVLDPVEVLRSE